MTSNMLAGERRWASARRGGMTVLGKVAVPKPLNLPSQKLENHGLDPNVEIVPRGSLSWGSRPSSSTSNPWGSSAISPKADCTTGSPSHLSGRPSSGGGVSRPSTAGSDRVHEPAASSWGSNSRPSSASGVLISNQSSATISRPLSADTRPGSSHLSRFAEPAFDNSVAWGPSNTAEKVMPPKNNDFSLSSGDFPTLGSEKDNAAKSSESHDHGSHVRPGSASGKTGPAKERHVTSHSDPRSGTVDTWTRDGLPHVEDGVRPGSEKWQGEAQQYVNPNVPPQHFDTWRGPPMNASAGVWYRGPPGGPPYPPVAHGGFPMEHFPYYRTQIPPALANPQPGPMPGTGPRGHHPKNGDFYRPQMPDAFIRPGMPIRPGFYPGPVPYDGYYGPPMGYNPNERDFPFMGMQPGPPVYNVYPPPNPSESSDAHFRAGGRGSMGSQLDSVRPEESRGPYKVLRKHENEWDADVEEENWEHTANSPSLEKSDQPRSSFHKNEPGIDARRNEYVRSRRNTFAENPSSRISDNRGYPSDSVIVHSLEGTHKSKASDDSWGKKSETGTASFPEAPQVFPAKPKDSSLIQKIEGLNAKVRASDVREDAASGSLKEEQKNILLVNPKGSNFTTEVGSNYSSGDLAPPSSDMGVLTGDNAFKSTTTTASHFSRRVHHGVQNRADYHNRGKSTNQDADGWRKRLPNLGSEPAAAVSNQHVGHTTSQVPDHHISAEASEKSETKNAGDSLNPMADSIDGQAQRAKMRELAKQRAIQLQKEEEERIREQKAKALAKLDELNRRTLAADGITQHEEKTVNNVPVQQYMDRSRKLTEPAIDASKQEKLSSDLDTKAQVVAQISEISTSGVGQSAALPGDSNVHTHKNTQQEPVVSQGQSLPLKQNAGNAVDDESQAVSLVNDGSIPRQKHTSHRQKQSVQVDESLAEKSAVSGTGVVQNPGTNLAVSGEAIPTPESNLQNNLNMLPESTTHQRRRINRSSKNKNKPDDASAPATASLSSPSREGTIAKGTSESRKPESQIELDSSTVSVTESKDAIQPNLDQTSSLPREEALGRATNQYKPQHSRKMPRNPQANRSADKFHGGDAVMWAPVRPQNKTEPGDEAIQSAVQDDVPQSARGIASVQTNLKSRRAEMERYVPKPVAKELAQQGSAQQPAAVSSPGKNTLEDVTEMEELGSQPVISVSGNVGAVVQQPKSGDSKQNKQVKSHGAWRQRGSTESHRGQGFQQGSSLTSSSSKSHHKPMSQHEDLNPVPTETNITHEWDPSDGWCMPEDLPTEIAPVTSVAKDGLRGKGKRPTFKGQKSTVNSRDVDHKNVSSAEADKNFMQSTKSLESNQTDRPASSKENRSSQWQPKSQAYRGSRSSGGQNASSEFKKDINTPQVQPEDPVADYMNAREAPHAGNQEVRRERKPASFRGRPHSPNQGMEDEAPFEQHHVRKSGGQNNRSSIQDNRQQHNGERQRQNSIYEYQQVGSNNNSKFNNFDAPADGSRNTGPRYRERGSGQSRRGGGNFYGRQSGGV